MELRKLQDDFTPSYENFAPAPRPIPQPNSPSSRSLSFSKPIIVRFEEYPNMDLALSPEDMSTLPESVIETPRPEKQMLPRLELHQDQRQANSKRISSLPTKMNGVTDKENVTTFSAPGWKPDVRLRVFERVFHVNSIVLRLYSRFFRKAMDVIDNEGAGMAASAKVFRYEFVSAAPLDGGSGCWTLERATEKPQTPCTSPGLPPSPDQSQDKLPPLQQISGNGAPEEKQNHTLSEELAFGKLLCAFYNKSFSVASFQELAIITYLAEQFSAIPCLSSSLYVALWDSPLLVSEIPQNCKEVLLLAQKLRHRLLFREALVHVVSQWWGWDSAFRDEYRLICVVTMTHNRVLELVLGVNRDLFAMLGKEEGTWRDRVYEVLREIDRDRSPMENRGFYEKLRRLAEKEKGLVELRAVLRELLTSKLVLERSFGEVVGGDGNGQDGKKGFLCANIKDEELPWDLEEEDW